MGMTDDRPRAGPGGGEPVPVQDGSGGEPGSPLELARRRWLEAAKSVLKEFRDDRGTLVAAGMAFYWFLAIFPALLASVGITAMVGASAETVASIRAAIESTLPGDAATVLSDALDRATQRSRGSSVAATAIGLVVALWSASAGMAALQVGLNLVYEVPKERPFLKRRLRALLLIVTSVTMAGLATIAIVFGPPIGDALRGHLPFGGTAFTLAWTAARWTVGLAALATLFAALYYLGPNRERPHWSWLSPGGVVGTLIWITASVGFSFYVTNLGSYGNTYGSLTGVVVLLLWLYLSAIAVLLGGEVNAELERQAERQRQQDETRAGNVGETPTFPAQVSRGFGPGRD
ncbi:MAG: YihY/virulence factor BrkB family protein [Actinomycetota bacterium]